MPDACGRILWDRSWHVVEANDAAHALLQVPNLLGMHWSAVAALASAGGTYVDPPTRLPLSYHCLLRLGDGSRRGILLYVRPVREGILARFEPAEWSLGFADQLPTAISVTNGEGIVVYANRAVGDIYGLPVEQMVGASARELAERVTIRPGDVETIFTAVGNSTPLTDTFSILPGDGVLRRLHLHTSPWRYHGLPCGTIWCMTDVTGHEEHDLQTANAVWYRLAATFQHELRNPLQTMLAAAELLHPLVPVEGARILTVLEQQMQLMSEYMLGSLQPPTPASLAPALLSDVAQAEIQRAAIHIATRRLTFTHQRPAAEPPVRLHRGLMARVFANLFRNSGQARFDAHVDVRYEVGAGSLACVVTDNGPGFVPEAVNRRMLKPRRDPIEHLGLAIVTSTVEAHGGTVTVANGPEGGACVTIRLPAVRPQEAADLEPRAAARG